MTARSCDRSNEVETRTATRPAALAEAGSAGHDVLLALAGRLPDRVLWRLRDWLASGAGIALRTALPRTLVRHRVGVTDDERALLRTAVLGWGGSARQVDAVLHADAPPEAGTTTFATRDDGPGWDATDLVLRALVPTIGGVGELRRAWRLERVSRRARAADEAPPSRVVLLGATVDLPALTGAVQRALRAQGEAEPRVEVIGPDSPATAYHRDALAASDVLWRADADASSVDASPDAALYFPDPFGPSLPSGELVRHG
jgi:hypothetical protein